MNEEESFLSILTNIRQDRFAGSLQELYRAAPKSRMLFTDSNELLYPAQ